MCTSKLARLYDLEQLENPIFGNHRPGGYGLTSVLVKHDLGCTSTSDSGFDFTSAVPILPGVEDLNALDVFVHDGFLDTGYKSGITRKILTTAQ